MPLFGEYLQEGRLGPCEGELRAYLGWLESRMVKQCAGNGGLDGLDGGGST